MTDIQQTCKGCGSEEVNHFGVCDDCLENHPALEPLRRDINKKFEQERDRRIRQLKRDTSQ